MFSMTSPSNGYEDIAETFIASRSRIGAEHVRAWAMSLPPGAIVLDLGCGHGVPVTDVLLQVGCRVHAIDASPRLVDAFRARFPDAPVACETVEESAFFDRSYDGVIAWGLMFLLPPSTQVSTIANMSRLLSPGGRLLFTSPAPICEWPDALTRRDSRSLGAAKYRRLLEASGLTLEMELDDEGGNHYYIATKE